MSATKWVAVVVALATLVVASVAAFGPAQPVLTDDEGGLYFGNFAGITSMTGQQGNLNDHVGASGGLLKWNNSAWLDTGLTIDNGMVYAMAINPTNGHMFIGGSFTSIGGDPSFNYIAEYDGHSFYPLQFGLKATVSSLVHNGVSLFVGGSFTGPAGQQYVGMTGMAGIVKWTNGAWQPMPGGGLSGTVNAMILHPTTNATLFVAGNFDSTSDYNSNFVDQQIPIAGNVTASATAVDGNFNPGNVIANTNRLDGPGNVWLLPPNTQGNIVIDIGYLAKAVEIIRVTNTRYNGGGAATIQFSYSTVAPVGTGTLPNSLIVSAFNPITRSFTSCSICTLPRDPTLPYVDFYLATPTDMHSLAINVVQFLNSFGGLASVQLFRRNVMITAFSPQLSVSGAWALNTSSSVNVGKFYNTIVNPATPSFSFTTTLSTPGAYALSFDSPACPVATCVTQLQTQVTYSSFSNTTTVTFTPGVTISLSTLNYPAGSPITFTFTPVSAAAGAYFAFNSFTLIKTATISGSLSGFVSYDLVGNGLPVNIPNWTFGTNIYTLARESPLNGNIIVGGTFSGTATQDNTKVFNNIARLNIQTGNFEAYPNGGLNGALYCAAPFPDGTGFAVGGNFGSTTDGLVFLQSIAIYNLTTSTWLPVGNGVSSTVLRLQVTSSSIWLGGQFAFSFQSADIIGSLTINVVRFNLADQKFYQVFDANQNAAAVLVNSTDDSSVYVALSGANTPVVGAVMGNMVAQKKGSLLVNVNGGFDMILNHAVQSSAQPAINAAVYFNNTFFVGGTFMAQGVYENYLNNLAMLNGSTWVSVGRGVIGTVNALLPVNNVLWIGGQFTLSRDEFTQNNPTAFTSLAAWNGTALFNPAPRLSINSGTPAVNAMALSGNNVIVAGQFQYAGSVLVRNIAVWDGANWAALGMGLDGPVNCILVYQNLIIVGGGFVYAGSILVNGIAQYDTNIGRWIAMPAGGYPGTGLTVTALAMDRDLNSLFVAGNFYNGANCFFAKYDQTNGFVPFGNQTSTLLINVRSMRVANAVNAPGNNWLPSGRVLVVYGSIQLASNPNPGFYYGSAIFDGYNWFPDTVVTNIFYGNVPVFAGFAQMPSASGLQPWQIALAVVFSIVGAALIAGLIAFVVLRMIKGKGGGKQ